MSHEYVLSLNFQNLYQGDTLILMCMVFIFTLKESSGCSNKGFSDFFFFFFFFFF
ncbi:hypothetical protein RHGRI_021446 [Rhododendron griersonianum]|uniref:Uncharacterized protein n=1 Tax=Rhododendron griersonianum TaxID=479676 RepID=A0AAV6JKI9_9ERIC|nr:hypothetical protein RHGRI_021446 [Rhododendron griersonianum]